ncbi:hypothetical protein A5904_05430 [Acidithiobacillus caldus]|nr:hypothetical protein A5904_05430 [Acidithiobacillus caldus]QER45345.1 hypothetical protein F0726_02288 [Acidithiobacillus caldus]
MMEADRFLDDQIEVLNLARDILREEGLPQDDYHIDVVLHALVCGTAIGLMDSPLADSIVRFSETHTRLHPSIGRDHPR